MCIVVTAVVIITIDMSHRRPRVPGQPRSARLKNLKITKNGTFLGQKWKFRPVDQIFGTFSAFVMVQFLTPGRLCVEANSAWEKKFKLVNDGTVASLNSFISNSTNRLSEEQKCLGKNLEEELNSKLWKKFSKDMGIRECRTMKAVICVGGDKSFHSNSDLTT